MKSSSVPIFSRLLATKSAKRCKFVAALMALNRFSARSNCSKSRGAALEGDSCSRRGWQPQLITQIAYKWPRPSSIADHSLVRTCDVVGGALWTTVGLSGRNDESAASIGLPDRCDGQQHSCWQDRLSGREAIRFRHGTKVRPNMQSSNSFERRLIHPVRNSPRPRSASRSSIRMARYGRPIRYIRAHGEARSKAALRRVS